MPNMKALSQTVPKLSGRGLFLFKVDHRSWSMSQVIFYVMIKVMTKVTFFLSRSQVKVKGQLTLYEWEALAIRKLHAKYKGSISNGSKVIGPRSFFIQSRSQVMVNVTGNFFI